MRPIRFHIISVSLAITAGVFAASCSSIPQTKDHDASEAPSLPSFNLMADGHEWTTSNLNIAASPSYCYDDKESNCRKYGRLYTWESAQRVCRSIGEKWRLPTDKEWRNLGKLYGGVSADSEDKGKGAFLAMQRGGTSGFHAELGGNLSDGTYARRDEHGFYWTASANDSSSAPFYNFGKNGQAVHRQPEGDKLMAISVRCIRP